MIKTEEQQVSDAKAIISNPEFDAVEFIEQVNIHYSNPKIVQSLSSEAMVLLSILDSGSYAYLEECPHFILPSTFEKLSEMGYETWEKKKNSGSRDSYWYGLYVDDLEMGITWKKIYGGSWRPKYDLELTKKPKETKQEDFLKALRKRWRQLKMLQKGVEHVKKERKEGQVFNIREKMIEILQKMGFSGYYNSRSRCDIEASKHGGYYPDRSGGGVHFRMLAVGPNKIRIEVRVPQDNLIQPIPEDQLHKSKNSWQYIHYKEKFDNNDPDLYKKVLLWVSRHDKGQKHLATNPKVLAL